MRLIDGDKFKTALDFLCKEEGLDILAVTYFTIQQLVDEMPTIDAEPIKYGRWIKSNIQRHVEVTYECSECQHEVVGEYEKTPFCGGCGARMDGDNK